MHTGMKPNLNTQLETKNKQNHTTARARRVGFRLPVSGFRCLLLPSSSSYLHPSWRWRRHFQQKVTDISLEGDLKRGQRYPVEVEEPLPKRPEVRPRRQETQTLGRVHLSLWVQGRLKNNNNNNKQKRKRIKRQNMWLGVNSHTRTRTNTHIPFGTHTSHHTFMVSYMTKGNRCHKVAQIAYVLYVSTTEVEEQEQEQKRKRGQLTRTYCR